MAQWCESVLYFFTVLKRSGNFWYLLNITRVRAGLWKSFNFSFWFSRPWKSLKMDMPFWLNVVSLYMARMVHESSWIWFLKMGKNHVSPSGAFAPMVIKFLGQPLTNFGSACFANDTLHKFIWYNYCVLILVVSYWWYCFHALTLSIASRVHKCVLDLLRFRSLTVVVACELV